MRDCFFEMCIRDRLSCDALFQARCNKKEYHPLPKFPAIIRDLALLCDDESVSYTHLDVYKRQPLH